MLENISQHAASSFAGLITTAILQLPILITIACSFIKQCSEFCTKLA